MQMRHELKHFISAADSLVLRQRLDAICMQDPHAGAHGEYRVRSLYFDNYRDKALLEKLNGLNRREKFRLRLYDGDPGFIRLEKKIKAHGLCAKASAPLNAAEVEDILAGRLGFMPQSPHPLVVELYSKMQGQLLRPKQVVEYLRRAYVYPAGNVRLTLDSQMHTGGPAAFLQKTPPLLDAGAGALLLEVKYDGFLPEVIRRAVMLPGRQRESFSKYALGRRYG